MPWRALKNVQALKYGTDLGRELILGKGFHQQLNARVQPAMLDDGILCIAGDIEYFEVRNEITSRLGEAASIHAAGQYHIRDQKFDCRALSDLFQGGFRATG